MSIAIRGRYLRLARSVLGACLTAGLLAQGAGAAAPRAFVTNDGESAVWALDTAAKETLGAAIPVGPNPRALAITPDGRFVYVVSIHSETLSVIDTAEPLAPAKQVTVGPSPSAVAITPDGKFAYVSNANGVSVIETATNRLVPVPGGDAIKLAGGAGAIAITPNGSRVYVVIDASRVVAIDTATKREVEAKPIVTGQLSGAIAISPDGTHAYVVNGLAANGLGSVSVINTATNRIDAKAIPVGEVPTMIAITPNGSSAYVTNVGSNDVSKIDLATKAVKTVPDGNAITVGAEPRGITVAPDGRHAYVADFGAKAISVIDLLSDRTEAGSVALPSTRSFAIVTTPHQGPRASFVSRPSRVRPGIPVAFDASASTDPDGTIVSYSWDFGDGTTIEQGPTVSHTFPAPGAYEVGLSLRDDAGCPSAIVFTGQTAYCNGSSSPQTITVAYPGVRAGCPKKARGGCRLVLQAIARRPRKGKRKARVLSRPVRARLGAGHSTIVSLKPKPASQSKLAAATKILVREAIVIRHRKRTVYRRLKVVQ